MFHGIDVVLNLVAIEIPCDYVALSCATSVPLLQLCRLPRYVHMVHGHYPLLYIESRTGLFGTAYQYAYLAPVHLSEQFLLLLVGPVVDESDLFPRDMEITNQLFLQRIIDIEIILLWCTYIAEDDLGSLMFGR